MVIDSVCLTFPIDMLFLVGLEPMPMIMCSSSDAGGYSILSV